MTTRTAIGVLAQAPLPGRCKTALLAAHSPEWVAGLYAAMLRDTLDGMQSIATDDYVVFVPSSASAVFDVLARHVPAPWQLVALEGDEPGARVGGAFRWMFERGAGYALLSCGDAPSFPVEPISEGFANEEWRSGVLVGPSEDGGYYVIGMPRVEPRVEAQVVRDIPWGTPAVLEMTRLRCKELSIALHELPKWYAVESPSDVLLLFDELRKHPDRAPRTAHFLVTSS